MAKVKVKVRVDPLQPQGQGSDTKFRHPVRVSAKIRVNTYLVCLEIDPVCRESDVHEILALSQALEGRSQVGPEQLQRQCKKINTWHRIETLLEIAVGFFGLRKKSSF